MVRKKLGVEVRQEIHVSSSAVDRTDDGSQAFVIFCGGQLTARRGNATTLIDDQRCEVRKNHREMTA